MLLMSPAGEQLELQQLLRMAWSTGPLTPLHPRQPVVLSLSLKGC